MTTPRKKTGGFSAAAETDEAKVEEFLEDVTQEMLETISLAEDTKPFVPQEITPTPDPGPRFLEQPPVEKTPVVPAPQLQPAPRRHPRNVPKFSRVK